MMALVCFVLGIFRGAQALRTLVLRASLSGRGVQTITTAELAHWCQQPDQVFLGFGFDWRPVHAQRLYELAKVDYRQFTVSPRLLAWLGYDSHPQPDAEIGLPYIHGGGISGDWTEGCVALDNAEMTELFEAIAIGTPVIVFP